MIDYIQLDRIIAKGRTGKILVVVFAVLIIVPIVIWVIGWVGRNIVDYYDSPDSFGKGLLWDTIEVYLDPSNKPDTFHFTKRFYFLFVGTTGMFLLNGLLVSMLVSWFENRRERWECGDLHYGAKTLGNFCIVIGSNEMVPNLVEQILKDRSIDHLLLMTERDVAGLRKKLVSHLGKNEEKVVLYYGQRTSKDDLELLHLAEAKNEIYVIGEHFDVDESSCHHDVKNMDCVMKMAELLQGIDGKKTCRVMFEYQSTFAAFQFADVCKKISETIDFRPFNYYETWAQKVFVCRDIDLRKNIPTYLPLEGMDPISSDCDDVVHLIIAGMSRMGVALAVEAAHLAHYPNFVTKGKLTRITFVDEQARKKMFVMQNQYRELFALSCWRFMEAGDGVPCQDKTNKWDDIPWDDPRKHDRSPYKDSEGYSLGDKIVDIEWQFIQGSLEMPSIQEFIRNEALKENERLTIAICFTQDNGSLASSLFLPKEVYRKDGNVQQVLVYQPYGDAMRNSFDGKDDDSKNIVLFDKLHAFGMIDGCFSITEQENIKNICETLELQYQLSAKRMVPGRNNLRKRLGLPIINSGKAPVAKRWSGYYSASHLWTKLRSVHYHLGADIDKEAQEVLAEVEHIRWNMEQLLMGFAPLKASEFHILMAKRSEALKTPFPKNELEKLEADTNTKPNRENYPNTVEWLEAWREYDDIREKQKADMSHADICSSDVLKMIDEEAMEYDRVIVDASPKIYDELIKRTNG